MLVLETTVVILPSRTPTAVKANVFVKRVTPLVVSMATNALKVSDHIKKTPGMALPVYSTAIYSMVPTAPYSVLSMPSAGHGSSLYHF